MSKTMIKAAAFAMAAAALGTMAGPATAAQLTVSNYSMPNGDGTASGGEFNYWDKFYTGSGATTTDGAALSGGKGDLTDGVVASDFWFNVENGGGTGPYVGWYQPATPNPTLTFNFAGSVTVNSIQMQIDNSHSGGVFSPAAVWVDGVSRAFTGPAVGTIGMLDITGLNLTGSSHTIQFFQDNGWVFTSEISFFGSPGGVPEPATWAMMLAGFGLAGVALRRRSVRPSVA